MNPRMALWVGAAVVALAVLIASGRGETYEGVEPLLRLNLPFFTLKFSVPGTFGRAKVISVLVDARNSKVIATDWSALEKSIKAGEYTAADALKGIDDAVAKGDINPAHAGDLIKKLKGIQNAPASTIATKFDDIASKSGLTPQEMVSQIQKQYNDMSAAQKAEFAKTGFPFDTLANLQSKYAGTDAGKRALRDLYKTVGLDANGYPKQGGMVAWANQNWGKLSGAGAATIAAFFLASELASYIQSQGSNGGGNGSDGSGSSSLGNGASLALFIVAVVGCFVCVCIVGVALYYANKNSS